LVFAIKRKTARPTSGAMIISNNGMMTLCSMMILSKRNIDTNQQNLCNSADYQEFLPRQAWHDTESLTVLTISPPTKYSLKRSAS
jgi:hypothetical protein